MPDITQPESAAGDACGVCGARRAVAIEAALQCEGQPPFVAPVEGTLRLDIGAWRWLKGYGAILSYRAGRWSAVRMQTLMT